MVVKNVTICKTVDNKYCFKFGRINEIYRGKGEIFQYNGNTQKIVVYSNAYPTISFSTSKITIYLPGANTSKDNLFTSPVSMSIEELKDILNCIKEMNKKL